MTTDEKHFQKFVGDLQAGRPVMPDEIWPALERARLTRRKLDSVKVAALSMEGRYEHLQAQLAAREAEISLLQKAVSAIDTALANLRAGKLSMPEATMLDQFYPGPISAVATLKSIREKQAQIAELETFDARRLGVVPACMLKAKRKNLSASEALLEEYESLKTEPTRAAFREKWWPQLLAAEQARTEAQEKKQSTT